MWAQPCPIWPSQTLVWLGQIQPSARLVWFSSGPGRCFRKELWIPGFQTLTRRHSVPWRSSWRTVRTADRWPAWTEAALMTEDLSARLQHVQDFEAVPYLDGRPTLPSCRISWPGQGSRGPPCPQASSAFPPPTTLYAELKAALWCFAPSLQSIPKSGKWKINENVNNSEVC